MKSKRVWFLLGDKLGDNAQLKCLGERIEFELGWEIHFLQLNYKHIPEQKNRHIPPNLHSLTQTSRNLVTESETPDLVIFTGRRAVPIARWVQQGSACRLVAIGKPRAPLSWFDLVITTRQYRLPHWPRNLILNDFTLNRAAALESTRVKAAKKNHVVVLLGSERSGFWVSSDTERNIIRTLKCYRATHNAPHFIVVPSKCTRVIPRNNGQLS